MIGYLYNLEFTDSYNNKVINKNLNSDEVKEILEYLLKVSYGLETELSKGKLERILCNNIPKKYERFLKISRSKTKKTKNFKLNEDRTKYLIQV